MRYLVLAFILIMACSKPESNCFKNAGEEITISQQLGSVTEIEIYDNPLVEIVHDSVALIEISYPENLIDGVIFELENGLLKIDNANRCRWLKDLSIRPKIKLHCNLSSLKSTKHYGAGNLTFMDSIRSPEFVFEQWDAAGDSKILYSGASILIKQNTGPGNISCSGKTENLYFYNTSLGSLNAEYLSANNGYLISNSHRVSSASVSESCRIEIFGKGDINLCPSPKTLEVTKAGEGQVSICE